MSVDVTIDRDKYIGGSDLPAILGLNKQFGKSMDDNAIQDENAPSLIYEQFGKLIYVNELQ